MKKILIMMMVIVLTILGAIGVNYYSEAKATADRNTAYEVESELDLHQIDFSDVIFIVHGNYKGAYEFDEKLIELPSHYLYTVTVKCVVPGHEEVFWHRQGIVNYRTNQELVDEINEEYMDVLLQMKYSVEKNGWA